SPHRDLHSFPTRRSSDLDEAARRPVTRALAPALPADDLEVRAAGVGDLAQEIERGSHHPVATHRQPLVVQPAREFEAVLSGPGQDVEATLQLHVARALLCLAVLLRGLHTALARAAANGPALDGEPDGRGPVECEGHL